MSGKLKAPFVWFGGKSRIASVVWDRFGDPNNYVEPFCGSAAVLLARPTAPRNETINDIDCYVANFWRAVSADPETVAKWSDYPVSEVDQNARHLWLVSRADLRERMNTDPDWFDSKAAGWWVYGQNTWIGSGWCDRRFWRDDDGGQVIHRKRPHLGKGGQGTHRQQSDVKEYIEQLANRLRRVRVYCGDWTRVLGPSVTTQHGVTAVFLDPPYLSSVGREDVYACDSADVASAVRDWAVANGDNPLFRIALCGYDGEHEMPTNWECVQWKAHGGYGSQGNGRGRENATRERIWFSPHCVRSGLFEMAAGDTEDE